MPIISADDVGKIQSFLQDQLKNKVEIDLFTQSKSQLVVPGRRECEYCEETRELLDEVAALTDKLDLKVHDLRNDPGAGQPYGISPDQVPALLLRGDNRGQVRYFGIPAGYEFSGFLQDLAEVSSGETKLSQTTKDELAKLPGDVHIRVFVTPT
jgi:alkyl hydroperoxide reductase subunit AhpF